MVDNTLTEICQDIHNWFDRARYVGHISIDGEGNVYCGTAKIGLMEGQYYRAVGSVFGDGVHLYPDADCPAEEFDGAIWEMRIPPAFLSLVQEIEDWNANERPKLMGAYSSENLSSSGYSYQRQDAEQMQKAASYKTVFGDRLNRWRKIGGV